MSAVQYFYLARAAQVDTWADRIDDRAVRLSLMMTADAWRLLARLAEDHGFDDLPSMRSRLPNSAF